MTDRFEAEAMELVAYSPSKCGPVTAAILASDQARAVELVAGAIRKAEARALREASDFIESAKPPMTNNATAVVRRNFTLIVDELSERADQIERGER